MKNPHFEPRNPTGPAFFARGAFGRVFFWLRLSPFFLLAARTHADVTYQQTIRPLFQSSCLNCHNPDKQKAGLDLSTYDGTMDGSDNGKVVETGDPDKSLLYKVLAHTEEPFMPKGGDKLPDSQLAIIRQWIQANAPEKSGGLIAKKAAGLAVAVVPVEQKPVGPPAMPKDGLLEPYIRTARRGAVPSVAGSPWAPLVALAAQKQILLYNTDTLELAGVLPFPEGFPATVRFSHNGSLLIAGGGIGAKLGHVVIWDVVTGRRIAEVGDEFDTVLAADISPDQSLVALGGPSRLVKIFSAADGHMICKMKKHTDWVTAISFTPDGKALISGDRAGGLEIWDTQGHELQGMSADSAAITGIACRGNLVATSSEDGNVKFWDIVEGKELKSWVACYNGVRSIDFTPDGHIVTSGRDHLVRLWDSSGNPVRQFGPLSDIAMQAASAGGKIVAADWRGLVRVWTAEGKRAGDLESNPPTIAQRIDYLNKRLAALQPVQASDQDACKRAGDALASARNAAAAGGIALNQERVSLAAARTRMDALNRQSAALSAAIGKSQQEISRLTLLAGERIRAAAFDPFLQPAIVPALASRALAAQSLAGQTAALAQTGAALAAAGGQSAAIGRQIDEQTRANAAALARVKSAGASLAAAQAAADKIAGQIKGVNLRLLKWRTAAARLPSNPEYASNKPVSK